jgi:hypothetical protein
MKGKERKKITWEGRRMKNITEGKKMENRQVGGNVRKQNTYWGQEIGSALEYRTCVVF